jgi:t-SNARE complex subunit (syntaxin)
MKSKSCQKFKAKYLKVKKDKTEDEFDLFINETKQRALNKELYDEF